MARKENREPDRHGVLADRAVMIFNDHCKLAVDPRAEARQAITELHMRQGQVSRA